MNPHTDAGELLKLADANHKDAEEFCRGAFGPFVSDVSQYVTIVAELMQHATDRALQAASQGSAGGDQSEVRSDEVQDTWFVDRRLPIMAMSGDIESDRTLKLHFRHKVTDADRKRLTEVLNAGEVALAAAQAPLKLADKIHDACPHKINEPPNCALVKSRLECVCEHVHMHAIRADRLDATLSPAMLDEIAAIWRLVHDERVSAEAIGIRVRNTWPALEASSVPSAHCEGEA